MNILVTGGCGFIGINFIQHWFNKFEKSTLINIDKLTYAGDNSNLEKFEKNHKYKFIKSDISNSDLIDQILQTYKPEFIVNFAAETHVDRSIIYPQKFIETNIMDTFKFLTSVNKYFQNLDIKKNNSFKFLHISTDEVYGSLLKEEPPFTENSKFFPNSPYSASKASSDHLVRAFNKTYKLPTIISNCSNNYGPYQSLEKFIPLIINNALNNKNIPIYGNGKQKRDWLFVKDHCEAIIKIILEATPGECYNIGSSKEIENIEVAKTICKILDKKFPKKIESFTKLITYIKDRPAHDTRYAIDSSKIKKDLGWIANTDFDKGIILTVDWYLRNIEWMNKQNNKAHIDWIKKQY